MLLFENKVREQLEITNYNFYSRVGNNISCFSRFGQKFVDKVANPKDMIHFTRRKITKVKSDEKGRHLSPTYIE
jgi:hypothetical protein